MLSLSRDEILEARDVKIEFVKVPEWGGEVCLKPMSGTDRDKFETEFSKSSEKKDYTNIRAKLLVYSICDAEGNKLFTEADITSLGEKNSKVIDSLFTIAQDISGFSKKDVEELEKN